MHVGGGGDDDDIGSEYNIILYSIYIYHGLV